MDVYTFLIELAIIGSALLIGVSVHESAHALAAYWLGDETAKNEGRITLNPVKHITWVTVVFALLAAIPGSFMFIPFKPVPIDHDRLTDQRWGPGLTAIAGPFSNLLLGFFFALTGRLVLFFVSADIVQYITLRFCLVQFMLFIFNMIPLPPLDGHWVLGSLIPPVERFFAPFRTSVMGFIILLILLRIPAFQDFFTFFNNAAVKIVAQILGLSYLFAG